MSSIPARSFVPTLCLVLASPAPSDAAPPPGIADVEAFDGLHERWQGAMKALGVPGFSIAVVRDGQVLALDAMGVRNPAGDPVSPDTIFYIASCTKTYTAAALAALGESGRVDLDAPVRTYLPDFKLADEAASASITVRDLLCHRPGLNSGPIVTLDAYTGEITEPRFYRWLARVEPTGEVGYSNLHFTVAGRVIDAATGRSWRDFLDERLFEPAGMRRTTAYASEMYGDADAAVPMRRQGDGYVACRTRKSDRTMHAAGGMGTSARDGATWLLLQLGDGMVAERRVMESATARSLRTRQSDMPRPRGQIRRLEGFGLGWMLGTYRGRPYATHGGGYVGTAAHLSFLPEEGLGVVVLANAGMTGQGLMDVVSIDVYDRLLGESGHRDLLPLYEKRAEEFFAERPADGADDLVAAGALSLDPGAYEGRYADEDWGTLTVSRSEGGELSASFGDLPVILVSTGPDAFEARTEGGEGYRGTFVIEDGRVTAVVCEDDEARIRFERVR